MLLFGFILVIFIVLLILASITLMMPSIRTIILVILSMWRKFGSAMATLQRWSWTSSLLSPSEDINCAFSASCSSRALPLLVARFLVYLAKLFRAGIKDVA